MLQYIKSNVALSSVSMYRVTPIVAEPPPMDPYRPGKLLPMRYNLESPGALRSKMNITLVKRLNFNNFYQRYTYYYGIGFARIIVASFLFYYYLSKRPWEQKWKPLTVCISAELIIEFIDKVIHKIIWPNLYGCFFSKENNTYLFLCIKTKAYSYEYKVRIYKSQSKSYLQSPKKLSFVEDISYYTDYFSVSGFMLQKQYFQVVDNLLNKLSIPLAEQIIDPTCEKEKVE